MAEVTAHIEAMIDTEHGHHRVGHEEPDHGQAEQSAFAAGHAASFILGCSSYL
jgi:hypothetical protein